MQSSFKSSFCFSLLSVVGTALVLSAATTPSRAAGPAYAWNGCYTGAELGGAQSHARWQYTNANPYSATGNADPQTVPGANFSDTRGVFGVQGGCNLAIGDFWVASIEASWFSDPLRQENNNSGFIPIPQDPNYNYREVIGTNISSVVSLTGRLGFAPSADWLLYGRGGVAFGKIETSGRVTPAFDPPVFDFFTSAWHTGWTAGAGVEYRLFRNVTIGAEYNYYSFGNVLHSGMTNAIDNGVPANPVNHRVNDDTQTVMARVNFNFDTPNTSAAGPYAAYAAYVKAPPLAQPVGQFSAFELSEAEVFVLDRHARSERVRTGSRVRVSGLFAYHDRHRLCDAITIQAGNPDQGRLRLYGAEYAGSVRAV